MSVAGASGSRSHVHHLVHEEAVQGDGLQLAAHHILGRHFRLQLLGHAVDRLLLLTGEDSYALSGLKRFIEGQVRTS